MMNEIKPGYKTTELYVTLIVALLNVLVVYGVLSTEEASAWQGLAVAGVSIALAIGGGVYAMSRAKVKKGE